METQPRRSFLARAVEVASAVPLVGLILQNFGNRTSYYEVDSASARVLEQPQPIIQEIRAANSATESSLGELKTAYREAYLKSHTRLVSYTYRVGKTTHTGWRTETYHTWEEPENVPKHTTIDDWISSHASFSGKVDRLTTDATIDLEKLGQVSVARQRTNRGSEGLASAAIYTPTIAALLLYEEAIAKLKHGHERHEDADELVERHDTQPQITRRSFFKAGAALLGAAASYPIVESNTKKREDGQARLEGEIEDMRRLSQTHPAHVFSDYFDKSPSEIIHQYETQDVVVNDALQRNVENERVRRAFANYKEVNGRTLHTLNTSFGRNVPQEIGDSIKSVMIAERLRDKSRTEHRAVYTSLGLTGLAVAGAIAGTLIPLEVGNEYFANRFEKRDSEE